MSKRYKDFSAAKDGLNNEPIVVEINGEKFEFPPFLSAKVVLDQLTWLQEDGSIAAPDLPKWFIAIMGRENFSKISDLVDFATLQEISTYLMGEYGLAPDQIGAVSDPEDQGDSPK